MRLVIVRRKGVPGEDVVVLRGLRCEGELTYVLGCARRAPQRISRPHGFDGRRLAELDARDQQSNNRVRGTAGNTFFNIVLSSE